MDKRGIIPKDDLLGVLRTILTFLENIHFTKTSNALRKEWTTLGYPPSVLTPCKVWCPTTASNDRPSSSEAEESQGIKQDEYVEFIRLNPRDKVNFVCSSSVIYKNSLVDNGVQTAPLSRDAEVGGNFCCQEALRKYEELHLKFEELQEEHKRLSGVATQLTEVLQTNILGQSQNVKTALDKCKDIYPDLFTKPNPPTPEEDVILASTPNNPTETIETTETNQEEPSNNNNNPEPTSSATQCLYEKSHFDQYKSISTTSITRTSPMHSVNIEEKKSKVNSAVSSSWTALNVVDCEQRCGGGDDRSDGVLEKGFLMVKGCNSVERVSGKASETCNDWEKSYFELDYVALKEDLLRTDESRKVLLLQALRWRITKSPIEIRQNIVNSYIKNDILDIQTSSRFLESFYCPNREETPNSIQEAIARLVNAFASLNVGRDYLTQNDCLLIEILLPCILGNTGARFSVITRDMLFATLQKLSLRNRQRQQMITSGLVEYLINFLIINYKIASMYCLEYCTALLMNLCLHKEAREICRRQPEDVVTLLVFLLDKKYSYCMPYVNGSMYSLMSDPVINAEAKVRGLGEVILTHMKCTRGEIHKQLDFIYKIHFGSNSCKLTPLPEPESEQEFDLLEDELDQNDTTITGTEVSGEQILLPYELNNTASTKSAHVVAVADPEISALRRPITPHPKSASRPKCYSDLGSDGEEEEGGLVGVKRLVVASDVRLVEGGGESGWKSASETMASPVQSPTEGKRIFSTQARRREVPGFVRGFGGGGMWKEKKRQGEGMESSQTPLNNVRFCYREQECLCGNANYCNKYMCGCYDSIRSYVDGAEFYDENSESSMSSPRCNTARTVVRGKSEPPHTSERSSMKFCAEAQLDPADGHIGMQSGNCYSAAGRDFFRFER